MKSRVLVILAGLFFALASTPAVADTITFYPGVVQDFRWTSPSGRGWLPGIGDPNIFRIDHVDVAFNSTGSLFQVYTNSSPTGEPPASFGILAIGPAEGVFNLGVPIGGNNAGGIYAVTAWQYSTQTVFNDGNWYYAGRYDQINPKPIPVGIVSGSLIGQGVVTWADIPGADPNYRVDIFLPGVNMAGKYFNLNILNCANWDVSGHIVPIPPSFLLFGSGLVGLILLRLKRARA